MADPQLKDHIESDHVRSCKSKASCPRKEGGKEERREMGETVKEQERM